jgi:hypothetical protein
MRNVWRRHKQRDTCRRFSKGLWQLKRYAAVSLGIETEIGCRFSRGSSGDFILLKCSLFNFFRPPFLPPMLLVRRLSYKIYITRFRVRTGPLPWISKIYKLGNVHLVTSLVHSIWFVLWQMWMTPVTPESGILHVVAWTSVWTGFCKRGNFSKVLVEFPNIKFHENLCSGSRDFTCGLTDTRGEANRRIFVTFSCKSTWSPKIPNSTMTYNLLKTWVEKLPKCHILLNMPESKGNVKYESLIFLTLSEHLQIKTK